MSGFDGVTDEDVLDAVVDGARREAAFHELVDRYEHRVYAICYRYFGHHADAEDATQDTFIAVLRNAGSFRGSSRLSTWMYRVAVNACNDIARKRARRPQVLVDDVALVADDADSIDAYAERETELEIAKALAELDELSRTLVILVAIQGLSYEQAAESMDLPVGTVKSRVHRARAKLAESLAHLRDDPAGPGTARGRPASNPT